MSFDVIDVDYRDARQVLVLVELLDAYARGPTGGCKGLSQYVRENLGRGLDEAPGAWSLLAYAGSTPAGFANCFNGFSTFRCAPLVNIHDIFVRPEFRGQGLAGALLEAIEVRAREGGCCKLTLEVLEGNQPAITAYKRFGFAHYQLDPALGRAMFWEKHLDGE